MIRYTNRLFSFASRRSHLQPLGIARSFCAAKPNPENKENQNENHEQTNSDRTKKEQMHDQYIKRALILKGSFEYIENKSKENYLDMIRVFEQKDIHRRNHVEFIYAALKNMEEFGVNKDISVYKALIDVMPKGKFIPTNIFQAEFQHYPKQQQCIIDLLEQMEDNGVIPDYEMEDMLMNIFGKRGHPLRKFWRMMYWMPKFKNLSPWIVPNPPPNDVMDLAKLAIERMVSVDLQSKIKIYQTSDVESAVDDTWIVSGQSPKQQELLSQNSLDKAVYIEGPYLIWLRNKSISYFVLRGDSPDGNQETDDQDYDDVSDIKVPLFGFSRPQRTSVAVRKSVHEQDDGIIYAICCTGMSSKDSLLSWIRLLEKDGNPHIANLAVLFKFKTPVDKELVVQTESTPTPPAAR